MTEDGTWSDESDWEDVEFAEFGDDDELSPQWTSWLIPMFVVANVIVFFATMSVNNCPQHSKHCVARFLGRFSFEHLRDNPLFGPSSLTYTFHPSSLTIYYRII